MEEAKKNNRFHELKETVKNIGIKSILVAISVILIVALTAAFIGNAFYATEKRVLTQQCELSAKETAAECDRCLLTRVNTVTMAGYAVDTMLSSGKDNDAIKRYMTEETGCIVETLDPSSTGLYGWINEEYLDGSGWIPDADYVPTERPWYIETIESDSEITFVEPYLDAQTNAVMMTVTDLMSDGKSVVAMDVSLEPIQDIVEKVSSDAERSYAFVLDDIGIVVAHSDKSQLGNNYLDEPDTLGNLVAEKIIKEGKKQFDIETDEGNYSVYVDNLEGGWYSVSLINSDVWYRPLRLTTIMFIVILIIIVLFLTYVYLKLNAKNQALERLHILINQEEKRGKELKILSETDRMTGLYDRVNGERKVNEFLSDGVGGMFFMLDIDNFKSYNDNYGHQIGDRVIITVAETLHRTFRANDITIRLGGDEFGVYAVGIITYEMAESIINRMFNMLEENELSELDDKKFYVSVGAVICSGKEKITFSDLYEAADSAMYTSKKIPGNSLTFNSVKNNSKIL